MTACISQGLYHMHPYLLLQRRAEAHDLGRVATAFLLVLGVLVGLVVVFPTFTVTGLVGALGVGGVVIGFAFQDTFQNLLAGVLLLLRQPFRIGDEIVSGDYTGTVEAIETRATYIRTYDGRRVIIPNSQIYSDPVQVIRSWPSKPSLPSSACLRSFAAPTSAKPFSTCVR